MRDTGRLAPRLSIRARAGAAVETVVAPGSARIELAALRRTVGELARERDGRLLELGEAVYEGNRAATKHLKKQLKELDEGIKAKEAEMTQVTLDTHERIGRAQLQVQPTEIALVAEEPVPEPAQIPEPFPAPGEGDLPQPIPVPEPYPPPDEGDRPQQPTIPEPGPQ